MPYCCPCKLDKGDENAASRFVAHSCDLAAIGPCAVRSTWFITQKSEAEAVGPEDVESCKQVQDDCICALIPLFSGALSTVNCFVDCQVLRDAVDEKARHGDPRHGRPGITEGEAGTDCKPQPTLHRALVVATDCICSRNAGRQSVRVIQGDLAIPGYWEGTCWPACDDIRSYFD